MAPSATPIANLAGVVLPKSRTVSPKVLMYHHVGALPSDADDIRKGLTVSGENFDAQIKFLVNNKYNVVTLEKLYELIAKGDDVSNTVTLTFDDGYDDNFNVALPIMEKYKVNGTFFVIASKIGQSEYMNKVQIKEILSSGNELGSHSVTHPSLDKLSGSKLKSEIVESKKMLEELSGGPVYSFCYPAGKFSAEAKSDLKESEYKIAVTTQAGKPFSTDKIFEVPRYRINPNTKLESLFK